jgi:hypothetical protein
MRNEAEEVKVMAWERMMRRRINSKQFDAGQFLDKVLPKKKYPESVRLTVVAMMTLAQLRLEKRLKKLGKWPLAFCQVSIEPCGDCPVAINRRTCPFTPKKRGHIHRAEVVYKNYYDQMPKEFRV